MTTQVIMPQLGESVTEGTVLRWLVQEGEAIAKYAPLLEVSTDKIDTEVPSPGEGILLRIYVPAGQTVEAGTLLAVIGREGEEVPAEVPAAAPTATAAAAASIPPARTPTTSAAPASSAPDDLGFISPIVAKLAAEHQVDLRQVKGTGMGGRIRKKDVLAAIAQHAAAPAAAGEAEIVPLSRMRQLIAEHMVQSKRTSPHVTTVFLCDMSAVVQHRYAHQPAFVAEGIALTFTPYFVSALVSALKQHPLANSSWTDQGLRLHQHVHVGIAVAVDDGLLVPVIKQADSLNLRGLARSVNDVAQRARNGQLIPDELQGGTFTLTNHGTAGSLLATPIINQPQAGILGVGAIHKQPIVISSGHPLLPDANDAIVIRPVAYLSFTFDHRILDGATADAFVSSVKHTLEHWPAP